MPAVLGNGAGSLWGPRSRGRRRLGRHRVPYRQRDQRDGETEGHRRQAPRRGGCLRAVVSGSEGSQYTFKGELPVATYVIYERTTGKIVHTHVQPEDLPMTREALHSLTAKRDASQLEVLLVDPANIK